jgi:DeoR/GlpR family transcriptional regulator of sugar metabolism
MPTEKKRDEVWTTALDRIRVEGKFKTRDLEDDVRASSRTIRDVLSSMEKRDWVRRTSPQSPIWRAGDKAKQSLNMTEEALKNAEA